MRDQRLSNPSRALPSFADAQELARRRLPVLIYDFIDGAAGTGRAAARNEADLAQLLLQPRTLVDVLIGRKSARSCSNARSTPRSASRRWACATWPGRERPRLRRVAASRKIPVCVSTASSTPARGDDPPGRRPGLVPALCHRRSRLRPPPGRSGAGLRLRGPRADRRCAEAWPSTARPAQRLQDALPLHGVKRRRLRPASTLGARQPRRRRSAHGEFRRGRKVRRLRPAGRATGADWAFLHRLRDLWKGG